MKHEDLAAVFTEWDRQWREDPGAFDGDVERLLRGETVEEYGSLAAITFERIASEIDLA